MEIKTTGDEIIKRKAKQKKLETELNSMRLEMVHVNKQLRDKLQIELKQMKVIQNLKKQNAILQDKFDRDINEHWECFNQFKKDFKENPMLAWHFAK